MSDLVSNANSSNQKGGRAPLVGKLAVLGSREKLRVIPEYMVPNGVVHTAEMFCKNMRFCFVSLDGEHFVGVDSDPSDWSPDRAADAIAGVGTCVQPSTFTPGLIKQFIERDRGLLKFAVTHYAGGRNMK